MKRSVAFSSLFLICATRTAPAQPAPSTDRSPPGNQVQVQAHLGVATSPFDVRALPEAKGQAVLFQVAARYAFSDLLSFDLNAPLVIGSVAQPAGSYVDTSAFGNPELGVRYRLWQTRPGASLLALSAALALGAPLASHDENLMPNRLLAVADGLEGRGRPEWFTPGVLPITASSALRWTPASWVLDAELRLPLLLRVSEASLPSSSTNSNGLGFASVLALGARYRLTRGLSLASSAHLFFDLVPALEHVRHVSRVQDFEQLSLYIHLGSIVALVIDLQTAIGGELGGTMVAGGLRGLVSF
jgi:hypothetical protein